MKLFHILLTLLLLNIFLDTNESSSSTLVPVVFLLLSSPESNSDIDYKEVVSPYSGRVWLDRNLGSSQVCKSYDEESCYGNYFQWGRSADGHELKTSTTTQTLSSTSTPGHSSFILTMEIGASSSAGARDWLSVPDSTLWSNNINNPCPTNYRLPTKAEFVAEIVGGNMTNYLDAFNSFLKLPVAGTRGDWYDFSSIYGDGSYGYYWTSSMDGADGSFIIYSNSSSLYTVSMHRSSGFPVRCIKN